jgi:hypothetical protein
VAGSLWIRVEGIFAFPKKGLGFTGLSDHPIIRPHLRQKRERAKVFGGGKNPVHPDVG